MNRSILAACALCLGGLISPFLPNAAARAESAEATATFAIANMDCVTCPISVRTAMLRVDGVRSVDIDFDAKTAVVVYDPAVTAPAAIAAASTAVGYPATQR